ncbi:hypothetical protein PoB_000011900 [Plakobranchus ocellatus]|uniref:Uncharacterized protein n=1 Tax=Plakobranchus ocellatus TaxID=259542 RepID=A0AAV3XV25_9GAST|nr:hypothetical protein PoB_000011900 [Plakobranchus ocellatus]
MSSNCTFPAKEDCPVLLLQHLTFFTHWKTRITREWMSGPFLGFKINWKMDAPKGPVEKCPGENFVVLTATFWRLQSFKKHPVFFIRMGQDTLWLPSSVKYVNFIWPVILKRSFHITATKKCPKGHGISRGVGGTVTYVSPLRSAGTLLSRVRAQPSAPQPD